MTGDHREGFRPVRDEVTASLPVEGKIPEWLSGTLLRNGPGTWNAGHQPLVHWFDGFAMLRRFSIRGSEGEVEYANRFLDTKAYAYARAHGEVGYREFATDPPGLLNRVRRLVSTDFTDNACVDLCYVGDRHLAMTEAPIVTEIDPETLATRGRYTFGGFSDTITVHPQYDFRERELVGYGTRFGGRSAGGYTLYSVPEGTEDVEIVAEIESDPPGYVHGFALTERYAAIVEPPFVPNRVRLLAGSSVIDAYEWHPERGTRVHVVSRDSGELVSRHRLPAFFTFHHVNAFERERSEHGTTEIVLDLIAYEDASVIDALGLDRLLAANPTLPTGELRRITLPIGDRRSRAPHTETLYPGHIELPMINYGQRNTREYRYAYGVGNERHPPEGFQNRLVKVDVRERTAETWGAKENYPGEPVFVPAPSGEESETGNGVRTDEENEDDGVLLSVVLDADAETSFLVVLDAETLTERARARCPHPIPFGFHGHFYAEGDRPTRSMA